MNLTLVDNLPEARLAAEGYAFRTGVDHVVVEVLPPGPVESLSWFLGRDMAYAPHRYTVLTPAEYDMSEILGKVVYETGDN